MIHRSGRLNETGLNFQLHIVFLVSLQMGRSVAARVTAVTGDEYVTPYPPNKVQTSYPSLLLFIPVSVVRQYLKPLSLYFLVICFLSFVKILSPFDPIFQLLPVLIVLSISVFRECVQEAKRQKEDKRLNSQKTRINREGKWVEVRWEEVGVGDVILVPSDSPVPADIVMVASSNPGNSTYIQTTNLDGETNFKPRFGLDKAVVTLDMITGPTLTPGITRRPEIVIHAEAPRSDLDWFLGEAVFHINESTEITLPSDPLSPSGVSDLPDLVPATPTSGIKRSIRMEPIEVCQLSIKNFIPREAVIKGTEWVIGVVVYTGVETKVLLGQQKPAYKVSKIDRITNQLVMLIILIQIGMAICTAAGTLTALRTTRWWLNIEDGGKSDMNPVLAFVISFFSCILLITAMIPISLVISLEIAKVCQAVFMVNDEAIPGTKAPSQALNDDLGQIGYILSDKTGTLTTNELVLKECTIGGVVYPDLVSIKQACDKGDDVVNTFVDGLSVCHDVSPNWSSDLATSGATRLSSIWAMKNATNKERALKSGASTPGGEVAAGTTYCGESPDEICLVNACAQSLGRILNRRSGASLTVVNPAGMSRRWGIVRFNAFDNLRRRSSIIVSKPELGDDKYLVFVKGSDDAVLPLCRFQSAAEQEEKTITESSLKNYAKRSLRTLVVAYKVLSKAELLKLDSQFGSDRANLINQIESGLTLLGCTGTEDRLQDGVQGSIHRMRIAGIAIWMITGDKLDTAVEISKSAYLISPGMDTVVIDIPDCDCASPTSLGSQSSAAKSSDTLSVTNPTMPKWFNSEQREICLHNLEDALARSDQVSAVVTGRSIKHLVPPLGYDDGRLIGSLLLCKSVVVCRSTKDQKAQVVKLIQTAVKGEVLVLSIGDGANDVPMIKQADVGVGVEGKEGRQAAQNADYVITKFSHLERLLLFHGRLNYVRTSKMVLYFFFKNLVLTFPFMLHQMVSAHFSSSVLVTSNISLSFNTLLTSIPVFALGLMERDVSPNDRLVGFGTVSAEKLAQNYPKLYMTGRQNRMFTRRLLGTVFVAAVLVGSWIYLASVIPLISNNAANKTGLTLDHWSLSQVYFLGVFVVDTAAAVLISEGVTIPMVLSIVYSCLICVLFFVSDAQDPLNPAGMAIWELISQTKILLPVLLIVCAPPVLIGIGLRAWRRRFSPTARMIWQQAKDRGDRRRKLIKRLRKGQWGSQFQLQRNMTLIEQKHSFVYDPENLETQKLLNN